MMVKTALVAYNDATGKEIIPAGKDFVVDCVYYNSMNVIVGLRTHEVPLTFLLLCE